VPQQICQNFLSVGLSQPRSSAIVFLRSVLRLLVNVNFVPSSPILVALMMPAISHSETSVLTRATRRHKPEDVTLRQYCFYCLKPSITLYVSSLHLYTPNSRVAACLVRSLSVCLSAFWDCRFYCRTDPALIRSIRKTRQTCWQLNCLS
jgi:hypothetical protein